MIFYSIIGLLANMINCYLLLIVVKTFCEKKYKSWSLYFFTMLLACIAFTTLKTLTSDNTICLLLGLLGFFVIISFFYKSKRTILLSILTWAIGLICSEWLTLIFISFILHIPIRDLLAEDSMYTVIAVFISNLLFYFLIAVCFQKKNHNRINDIFSNYHHVFFISVMFVLCNSAILFERLVNEEIIGPIFTTYFFVCIILMFISIVYLSEQMILVIKENMEARQRETQNKAHELIISQIHTMIEHLNTLNHDYRHHLATLQKLVGIDGSSTSNYVKSLIDDYSASISFGYIHNLPAISLLIMEKSKLAAEHDIKFSCQIPQILNTNISEVNLNIILSNLLENAFEALLKKNSNRQLNVDIFTVQDCFFIKIANTYDGNLNQDIWKDRYYTTKKEKHLHGIGLKSVKDLVEKFDGIMRIETTDNLFYVTVSLPLNAEI